MNTHISLDIDGNGTTDFVLTANRSIDPVTAIDILSRVIRSLSLDGGVGNSLLAKVNAARNAVSAGKTNEARNVLNALLNEIQAQSGKKITMRDAQGLSVIIGRLIQAL